MVLAGHMFWFSFEVSIQPRVKITANQERKIMSPEISKNLPEGDADGLNLKETELTLGIPGETRVAKAGVKRPFLDAMDLKLNTGAATSVVGCSEKKYKDDQSESEIASVTSPPASRAQVVGWPPVGALRKNMMKSCKYVKVAVDGALYLRKIDLCLYSSYQQLLSALEELFTCLTIRNVQNERKLIDPVNGVEYVATYEDKDGDWMLVGDVPWNMFVESCKRLRLMKSSEAIGLAPGTPPKCSRSSC